MDQAVSPRLGAISDFGSAMHRERITRPLTPTDATSPFWVRCLLIRVVTCGRPCGSTRKGPSHCTLSAGTASLDVLNLMRRSRPAALDFNFQCWRWLVLPIGLHDEEDSPTRPHNDDAYLSEFRKDAQIWASVSYKPSMPITTTVFTLSK